MWVLFFFRDFHDFRTFCSMLRTNRTRAKRDQKMIEKLTENLMVKIYRKKMEIIGFCPFSGVKNSPVPAAIGAGKIPPPNAQKRPKAARNVAQVL